jgi:hypothetical protein
VNDCAWNTGRVVGVDEESQSDYDVKSK